MSVRIGGPEAQAYHRQREAEALRRRHHTPSCICWDCVWLRAVDDATNRNHDPGDEDRR